MFLWIISFNLYGQSENLNDSNRRNQYFVGIEFSGRHFMDFSSTSNKNVPRRNNFFISPEIGYNITGNLYSLVRIGYGVEKWYYKNQYNYNWSRILGGIGLGYKITLLDKVIFFNEIKPSFEYVYYKNIDFQGGVVNRQETPIYILGISTGLIANLNDRMSLLPQLNYSLVRSPVTRNSISGSKYTELVPKLTLRYTLKQK